jgi:hypothetical protein
MNLNDIPVTDPQLPQETPLLDALAAKVGAKLDVLRGGFAYDLFRIDDDEVEEATREVLPNDAELLKILLENPSLGDISLPLDWTDDNDLSVYSVLQGAIVAEMQDRFSEEEEEL